MALNRQTQGATKYVLINPFFLDVIERFVMCSNEVKLQIRI
jgi:hypothetical protein